MLRMGKRYNCSQVIHWRQLKDLSTTLHVDVFQTFCPVKEQIVMSVYTTTLTVYSNWNNPSLCSLDSCSQLIQLKNCQRITRPIIGSPFFNLDIPDMKPIGIMPKMRKEHPVSSNCWEIDITSDSTMDMQVVVPIFLKSLLHSHYSKGHWSLQPTRPDCSSLLMNHQ